MFNLGFGQGNEQLRLLCIGAHSDDIEIGCGGTILRLLEENPNIEVCWLVLGATGERAIEASDSADLFLQGARQKHIITKDFRDGFFPYIGVEIKEYFEALKQEYFPNLILTHYRHDLHQDHRLVSDLTWSTFRNHKILEYEIIKYDGDLGNPNFFVHLDKAICRNKIQNILKCFGSQRDKHWFTEDTFLSMLRIRGVESNAPDGYAEAYYCRKAIY